MTFNKILNSVPLTVPGTIFDFGSKFIKEAISGSSSSSSKERSLEKETALLLKKAPTKDAYLQIIAQNATYCDFKDKQTLERSKYFSCPNYQVHKTISYPKGIKAIVLTPDKPSEAPIVAIRGTDTGNMSNLIDDVNAEIGEINCTTYAKDLQGELESLYKKHGRIHLIGHSYGGTVAQRLTAEHPELIARLTTHNSPGAGKKVVKKHKKNLLKLPRGVSEPEIERFRHAKDIPSLLGGKHLPTTSGKSHTTGTIKDKLSYFEAHSLNGLSLGAKVISDALPEKSIKKLAKKVEKLRKGMGFLVPVFKLIDKVIG